MKLVNLLARAGSLALKVEEYLYRRRESRRRRREDRYLWV